MFPVTNEVIRAEQSRRLEGYGRWSRRHGQSIVTDVDDTRRPVNGHQPRLRPAFVR